MRSLLTPSLVNLEQFFQIGSLMSPTLILSVGVSASEGMLTNFGGSAPATLGAAEIQTGVNIFPSMFVFGNSGGSFASLISENVGKYALSTTYIYGGIAPQDTMANYTVDLGTFPSFGGLENNSAFFHGNFLMSNVATSRLVADGTPVLNWTSMTPSFTGEMSRWRSFLGFPKSTNDPNLIFSTWDAIGTNFFEGTTTSITKSGLSFEPPGGIPAVVANVPNGNVMSVGILSANGSGFPLPGAGVACMGDIGAEQFTIALGNIPFASGLLGAAFVNFSSQLNIVNNETLRCASRGYSLNAAFGTGNHFALLTTADTNYSDEANNLLDYCVYDDFEKLAPNAPNPAVWNSSSAAGPCQIDPNPGWDPGTGFGHSLLMQDGDPTPGVHNYISHDFTTRGACADGTDHHELFNTIFVGIDSGMSGGDGTLYLEWWEDDTRTNLAYAIKFEVAAGVPVAVSRIQPGRAWSPISPVTYQYPSGASGPTFQFDSWYAIQVALDTSAQHVKFYLNGVDVLGGVDPFCEPALSLKYFIMHTGDGVVDPAIASIIGARVGFFLASPSPHDLFTYHWPNDGPVPVPYATPSLLSCMSTMPDLVGGATYDGNHSETLYAGYSDDGGAHATLWAIDCRVPSAYVGGPFFPIPKNAVAVDNALVDTVYDISHLHPMTNSFDDARLLVGAGGIYRYDFSGAPVAPTATWGAGEIGADHRYVDPVFSLQIGTLLATIPSGYFPDLGRGNLLGFVAGGEPGAGATMLAFGYDGDPDGYTTLTTTNGLLFGLGTDDVQGVASTVPVINIQPWAGSLRGGGLFSHGATCSWTRASISFPFDDPVGEDLDMNLVGANLSLSAIFTNFTRIDHLFGNVYILGTESYGAWLWIASTSYQNGFAQLIPLILPVSAVANPSFVMLDSPGFKAYPTIVSQPTELYYYPPLDGWMISNQQEERAALTDAGVPFFTWICHDVGTKVDGVASIMKETTVNRIAVTKTDFGTGDLTFTLYAQEPGGGPVAILSQTIPDTDTYGAWSVGPTTYPRETLFWVDISAWPTSVSGITARVQLYGLVGLP